MKKTFFSNKVLVVAIITSIAIASTEVPLWISAFALMIITWKYLHEKFQIPKFQKKLTPIIGLALFFIVYIQYKTILGQEESTTILIGLVALTVLNYETERDSLLMVLLGFLLVAIKSIFSLDLIWIGPAVGVFFGLWYSLLGPMKINKAKFIINTALRALPLVIVLFIFFPRLVVFQTEQAQKKNVSSGFSEDLNPGRISELVLQNQTVFRAEFSKNILNSEQLYWRGAVLDVSDGFFWKKSQKDKILSHNESMASATNSESVINYNIILEPMNIKNIFLLETPIGIVSSSVPIRQFHDQVFSLVDAQNQQIQIVAQSNLVANLPIREVDLKKYLQYAELSPKAAELVSDIKIKHLNPENRIESLKMFFSQSGFIYTLKPDVYKKNLDEFLFERKKGFCEHFAASFATLSRALEVPSRVVIGYQSGQYNSIGNFWRISQKDAHAWVEVNLNRQWVRIDPTGLVSPLRIALGGESYFSLSEEEQIINSKNLEFKRQTSFFSGFNQITAFFENINYRWTLLLLDYDLQAQLEIIKKLKIGQWFGVIFILFFVLLLIIYRNRFRKASSNKHLLYNLILQIESWAQLKGIRLTDNATPLQNLAAISKVYPEFKVIIEDISGLYINNVYQEKSEPFSLRDLEKRWAIATKSLVR